MKKIILLILLCQLSYFSYSQCPANATERTSVASTNDGFVQTISNNFYTDEYVTISNILNTDQYEFISTHGGGIHDYITITDESNVPITNGYNTSPLVISNITLATIRVHIRTDAACNTDLSSHILTLVDLTEAPNTCQKPTVSPTSTLTYRSDKRMDITWYAPIYSTPEGYDWMFVPQGGGASFSGSTVAPITSISTGDVLASNTTYDISIRSTCGINGNSEYTTFSIKTNVNPPPSNDFCSGAFTIIEETSVFDAASATIITLGDLTGGAGTDTIAESCGGSTGNARDDIWFKFVAKTTDINITVEPNPSFDAVVTLYSGDCNTLSYLSCSDIYSSSLSPEEINDTGLTIGNTYFVRVYNYGPTTPTTPTFNIKIWSTTSAIDADNDGYVASVDCDDNDANEFPGQTWHLDADGDGYSEGTSTSTCERPTNYFTAGELTQINGDCDDSDSAINPDTVWYLDADGDNYAVSSMTQCTSPGAGYTTSVLPLTDCDDSDSGINPDTVWYLDADGDNYAVSTMTQCTSPGAGYTTSVLTLTDCDDSNALINPDATEIWYDGVDQNCDGLSDYDQDGDGYDSESFGGNDCDDTLAGVNPGAAEIEGNGLDDDCNPSTPDVPLGVEEFNLDKVKISPNPFNQSIMIQLPLGYNNDNFSIGIYDINGREIFQRNVFSNNSNIRIDNLNILQQGMYFIKITSKEVNKSVVRELIKY